MVQKPAKEVQRYKVVNKVTNAEALKGIGKYEIKQNSPIEYVENLSDHESYAVTQSSGMRRSHLGRPPPPQQPCDHKCKVENTLIVEKIVCKVVNVATRQERKSDRIKTEMEVAEEFLGIKDLKAEDIHSLLMANNDGGGVSVLLDLVMVFHLLQWNARRSIANGQELKKFVEDSELSPDVTWV